MRLIIPTLTAVALGGVSYLYLAHDLLLAVWTALTWYVAIGAVLKTSSSAKGLRLKGSLLAGTVTMLSSGAALLGVGPYLPIALELRLALQLLVMGTGFACGAITLYLVYKGIETPSEKS